MKKNTQEIMSLNALVSQYRIFMVALLPLLQQYADKIETILRLFQLLRQKGKTVVIVENSGLTELHYRRFLDGLGMSRNSYQHVFTSMGHLQTLWRYNPAEKRSLGPYVYVIGDYSDFLMGYERISFPEEADWILCGELREHHKYFCARLETTKFSHEIPIFLPRQDIDPLSFQNKQVQDIWAQALTHNPKLQGIQTGFPQSSFTQYLQEQLGLMDWSDVLFMSSEQFSYWAELSACGMTTMSIGSQGLGEAQLHMNELMW